MFTLISLRNTVLGLSLLCSKICLLCFLAFSQFSTYYACFYAFQKYIMLLFCVFSLCREVLHMTGEVSIHTNNNNTSKLGCVPEFVGILEQRSGHIHSPSEAVEMFVYIFVVLYTNNYV